MNLCLISRSSLDELEELAKTCFVDVPNKDLPMKDFKDEVFYTKEHSFSRIYKVVPDKNLKQMKFMWVLPATSSVDVAKSARYLSHVIGHEGPNSLLSHLIKEGLG
jgi:insulysin